jgi:hypothetical protein
MEVPPHDEAASSTTTEIHPTSGELFGHIYSPLLSHRIPITIGPYVHKRAQPNAIFQSSLHGYGLCKKFRLSSSSVSRQCKAYIGIANRMTRLHTADTTSSFLRKPISGAAESS